MLAFSACGYRGDFFAEGMYIGKLKVEVFVIAFVV